MILPGQDEMITAKETPSQTKRPASKDFLDQDILADDNSEALGESSVAPSTHKPPVRTLAELRADRRQTRRSRPSRTRSLSPTPNPSQSISNSAPHHDLAARPRRKTPARSFSANAAVAVMDLLGIPLEESLEQNDDDNYDDYKVKQSEIDTLVNDREEFLRLKSALKAKGAVTNGVLAQRLHVYVHKNRERLQNSNRNNQQRESDCSEGSGNNIMGVRQNSED